MRIFPFSEGTQTKAKETADSYIERLAYQAVREGKDVFVVTSDGAEQSAILGAGAYRITVKELRSRIKAAKKKLKREYIVPQKISFQRNSLSDRLDADVLAKLEELRRRH